MFPWTVSLAIATGKLDLCIQGLFGAGKSPTAAILLSGLLALDKEGRCHFQVICKENTGARSFANMLLYLEVPTDLRLTIGRFVADSEANKSGSGTYFDIFHSSKREGVQQCRLLLLTGGSCAGDRASPFSTLEAWQQKLVMVVIQQYGGDREVASVAMLPPTCMVVWTGDAQQTPGGIAKGPSQIAITRRQLISRKHALRCPQDEYTPHTLFQALMKLVSHLDLPVGPRKQCFSLRFRIWVLFGIPQKCRIIVHAWISLHAFALIAHYDGMCPQLMMSPECQPTLSPLLWAKRSIPPHFTCWLTSVQHWTLCQSGCNGYRRQTH